MNENDKKTVLTLLARIKWACLDDEMYHQILGDLILKGDTVEKMILCAAMTSIIEYLKPENKCQQPVKEMLCQELHQSWQKTYGAVVAPDAWQGIANTLPAMLAWGYETKQLNKKSAKLSCRLTQLDVQQLAAFWKAIEISGIESINELEDFADQRSAAWQISCDGIAKSHLTSFIFGGVSYLQKNLTVEMWQFFCNAIKKSSIIHLDLCSVQACKHPVFDELWGIFCDSLKKSKIKSLNLQQMGLYNLTLPQWLKLYYAASQIKLESLDLTCNYLFNLSRVFSEEENYNNQLESWKVVCDLIKLPSLKNLKFKKDYLEWLTQEDWMALCAAIKESNIETLDIGISGSESLPSDDRWKQLLQALQIPSLKSLQLTHSSAQELSAPTVKELCSMIETSSLQSITLKHSHGNISLQPDLWNMLGEALKKKGIKSWDFGSIKLSETNLSGFFEGVKRSGVTTLHIRNHDLKGLSPELWTKLALWMRKAGISTLEIDLESNPIDWGHFCEFIVNTNIKSLIFNFQLSCEPKLQPIEELGNAIKRSNLETLNLSFPGHKMRLTYFNILLEGIKKSKINNLTLPNIISPEKSKALSDAMFVVNARAKHKNTLLGLCADTLFRKYNARLTKTKISYEDDKNLWEDTLLDGEKEVLLRVGIS